MTTATRPRTEGQKTRTAAVRKAGQTVKTANAWIVSAWTEARNGRHEAALQWADGAREDAATALRLLEGIDTRAAQTHRAAALDILDQADAIEAAVAQATAPAPAPAVVEAVKTEVRDEPENQRAEWLVSVEAEVVASGFELTLERAYARAALEAERILWRRRPTVAGGRRVLELSYAYDATAPDHDCPRFDIDGGYCETCDLAGY